jgi:hypothetical protein
MRFSLRRIPLWVRISTTVVAVLAGILLTSTLLTAWGVGNRTSGGAHSSGGQTQMSDHGGSGGDHNSRADHSGGNHGSGSGHSGS